MTPETMVTTFQSHLQDCSFAVIEGNRGLYDGVSVAGEYSTAELALLLDLPVLTVVNCAKTTRTVAALVLGCQAFDPRLRFAGVILSRPPARIHCPPVGGALHRPAGAGASCRGCTGTSSPCALGVTPHPEEYAAADGPVAALAAAVRPMWTWTPPARPWPTGAAAAWPRPVRVRADG